MKYFDIRTPAKKINGWERSLQELTRMMNVKELHSETSRLSHRKATKAQ